MPPRASSAVIRISVLAFLIVLSSRAQETNSTNPPVPEEAKAVEVNWLYGAYVPKEIPLVTLTGRQRFKLYLAQVIYNAGNLYALLGYEPRYDRCRSKGFWPRTGHAFIRNFVTYNRTEKQLRPQFALYAGALGSGATSSLWFSAKPNAWVEGYQAMILQAGWGLATNWVGEFAPEIARTLKRKK